MKLTYYSNHVLHISHTTFVTSHHPCGIHLHFLKNFTSISRPLLSPLSSFSPGPSQKKSTTVTWTPPSPSPNSSICPLLKHINTLFLYQSLSDGNVIAIHLDIQGKGHVFEVLDLPVRFSLSSSQEIKIATIREC